MGKWIVLLLVLVMTAVATVPATAGKVSPVMDPVVRKECGSCHMAFPPEFLPARSWQKLVDTLSNHFGEDASLGETQRQAVLAYLTANAADSPRAGREGLKFLQNIAAEQTPLRITDTPRWVKKHREVKAEKWKRPDVNSKSNCIACHKTAEQGIYED